MQGSWRRVQDYTNHRTDTYAADVASELSVHVKQATRHAAGETHHQSSAVQRTSDLWGADLRYIHAIREALRIVWSHVSLSWKRSSYTTRWGKVS